MLAQLSIRNFALIDAVTLEFRRGFNVLTGETGAGKSILIDAITAALGERAGADLVRRGADRASVEAVFEIEEDALPLVSEWAEDGLVILSREISASGRSSFRINGRMCTASTVRDVAADLIDIHGQHDHQSLLNPERHVEFLDAWSGRDVVALRRTAQERLAEYRSAVAERERLATGERDRVQRLDLYRFQLEEIDSAKLDLEEEEELTADRSRLANAERLAAGAGAARGALDEAEPSALDLLASAAREVETLAELDMQAGAIRELLETALAAAQEAASELRGYVEAIEFNPERLAEVQERLDLYRSLKRKYGDTVEEILSYRERIAAELEALDHSEERQEELARQCAALAAQVEAATGALYAARKEAAARFETEIAGHLGHLNMAGTRFAVQLDPPASLGGPGEPSAAAVLGRAEFLISANAGEPLRPLAKIASGGEMSRVMLALKTAMAGSHPVALIFDEIDAGVGGKTAEALGAKMAELSKSNQVLCITHLPQIACLADLHVRVRKGVEGERTVVDVAPLEGEARIGELARMLGGSEATAVQHARELLAASAGPGVAC
ncbi:MAG: DNA repair protein RecN [Armatimonadota bacterium]